MQAAMEIMLNQAAEEDDADFDEMGVAETYSIYWPAKLTFGKRHPDPVVETSSLSSVEPCDIHYKLSIPQETIQSGSLSALQLESITYASQAHEHELPDCSRAGFLIGDGAGVGKGRTVAGIIFENYQHGRKKALWISVSNDLKYDAERDLSDIGASEIKVHALNKLKYANIVADGVLFSTYSALIGKTSMRNAKHKTRLSQILQWCGDDFDGLIIFDECHKAKNLCPVNNRLPSKTGVTVLELQNSLPQARVVYASATGASEPKNMAYMVRLGIWGPGTPFRAFCNFIQDVEERGVGFMEIVAMDMKLRGMYIARQLSFREVTFKIEEVPFTEQFRAVYDDSVALWVEALDKFKEAATLVDSEGLIGRTMWAQFWASHQRFFKYLCIAAKVSHAVRIAREAIKQGKCVVIGLQSTGEARTLEQLEKEEGELNEFVSTAKGVFQALVEKQFPAPDRDPTFRVLEVSSDQKYPVSVKKEEKPTVSLLSKRRSAAENAAAKISRLSSSSGVECDRNSGDSSDSDLNTLSCYAGPLTTKLNSERISQGIFVPNNPRHSSADSDFSSGSGDSESDSKTKLSRNTRKRKMSVRKSGAPKKLSSTQIKIRKIVQQNKEQKSIVPKVEWSENKRSSRPTKIAMERACSMKEELLGKIELLGHRLPPNTLDQLIDELGGPEHVAEMTGRKGRVVQKEYGDIQYESRSELDIPVERLNLTEKQRFMDGEKDIAIISEAASSGISLQSDRRVANQRRRVHITLELPWSADRAIQQFGRTHRSNQVNAPEYVFLISDLAGERRFASTVAKRLESLGALTHGDRRATESRDLSEFNIDNKYGQNALETVMESIMDHRAPLIPPPTDYEGNFFKDIAEALLGVGLIVHNEARQGVRCLDKDYDNISKFLNRILGIPVGLQNRLFKYFTDTLEEIIMEAKKSGRFDLGILDLGTAGDNVTPVKLLKFFRQHATGSAPTEVHTVRVERGLTCQEALAIYNSTTARRSFYLSYYKRNNNYTAILAVEVVEATQPRYKNNTGSKISKNDIMFEVYRPNTGLQIRLESLAELEKKYRKVKMEEAEPHWTQHYEASVHTCSHTYWNGSCKRVTVGFDCEFGLRQRLYTVLSGSVLAIWLRVERIFKLRKMQVIRLKTTGGQKIVGTLVPKSVIQGLIRDLKSDADKTEEILF